MKPQYRKLPAELDASFSARHYVMPNFGNILHYHEQLELRYIICGEGQRFIGDNVDDFMPGELILLGEKLSHAWRCSDNFYQKNPNSNAEAIIIQFLPTVVGKQFLQIPESYLIPRLFEKAKSGLKITGKTNIRVATLMKNCVKQVGLSKILILLEIIKIISESDEYEVIIKTHTTFQQVNEVDNVRLNNVFAYTYANYKKNITLGELAEMTNLSITSFCRYFKNMTRKRYYDFLVETRINHACRLLVENKLSAEYICFECGFNNVSNFYRHFKRVVGQTPAEYKRRYLNNV